MEEAAQPPTNSKYRLPRRPLLKGIAGGVAGGLIPKQLKDLPSQETLTSSVLKEKIEKQFNVEIKTLKELLSPQGKPYPPSVPRAITEVPNEWGLERLKILDTVLSILPPHFYAPDLSGKKMRITLGITSTNGMFATAGDGYYHELELDYKRFKPENPRLSFVDVAHECTHLLVPETREIEKYTTPDGARGERVVFKSPWYNEIEQIFGEPFSTLAPNMRELVLNEGYVFVSNQGITRDPLRPPPETNIEEKEDIFAEEFHYGFRKDYPGEFIPVLAQIYLQGEEYFFAMYTKYLDQEVVEKLYEFSKNTIFQGKEYDSAEVERLMKMAK